MYFNLACGMKQKRKIAFLILVVVLGAVLSLVGLIKLYTHNKPLRISFADWIAVKPITEESDKFRFAIASMVSTEETWVTYKKLIDYVAGQFGNEASMVLRPSYSDVRILLEEKKIDIALVCTGTYITCSRAKTIELVAAPEFKNNLEYRCLFVVNNNSTINNFTDLQDRSFAFTDPESNTGCIVPRWFFLKQGKDPKTYFSKIIYTGGHDRSLHAVAKGLVDGAGVDSLIYYSFLEAHPELKEHLRVIWESAPFGVPPVVVPSGLPKSTVEQLREILLTMHQDEKGREILDGIGIERFRMPQSHEYDSAHEIWDTVGNPK
ncbi:MAG: phosphate/phosphite/phosphonate ABC transporter substrate-binding protein [Planctomycetes bacterium]|nr:phosphate/phosphite/phosphonate ABC transporter substrate-binding protein [Planctomycetota bacterium]